MGSANFAKREREKQRQERAARKRERRAERSELGTETVPDQNELMERFRILSESLAAGTVTREAYEVERTEIFEQLGVVGAFDD